MDALIVLTFRIDDVYGLLVGNELTGVANLSAHLAVERCVVKHYLIEGVLLLSDLAITQDVAVIFVEVVTDELLFTLTYIHPVTVLHGGSVAGTCFLLGHFFVKSFLVDGVTVLTADKLGEVDGETVGVEETESLGAVECGEAVGFELVHVNAQQLDAFLKRAQETVFLLLDDLCDELLLLAKLWVGTAHLMHEHGNEFIHECALLVEECIGIANGTTQDATDDVAGLGVAGQLTVGDGKSNSTQVVCHHADGDVYLLLGINALTIGALRECMVVVMVRQALDLADDRREDVGVVVGVLALKQAHKTLKAHACIDDMHLEGFKGTVGLAVELHEYDVPDLNDLRMVFVDQLFAGNLCLLFFGAQVNVNLRARTARSRVAHLPEVVMLVAIDDMVGGEMLSPVTGSLIVAVEMLVGITFKHRHVEVLGIEMKHVDKVFVGIIDGPLLKIITKAPVAQHLKHGVVREGCVASYLFKVIVLSADAQTFLRISAAPGIGIFGAKDNVFPLVHARIGEHQCGVVLHHNGGGRNDNVSF